MFLRRSPLITPSGTAIGTVALLDTEPRTLSDPEVQRLETVAAMAMDQLEERRYLETFIGNPLGFAYRHRNVPGWPLELIHPGDRRYVRRAVDQGLSDTGRYELTYRIITKRGERAGLKTAGDASRLLSLERR